MHKFYVYCLLLSDAVKMTGRLVPAT